MTTIHGGLDTAELRLMGLQPEQVLDFSANINPLGSSRRVRQAAAAADLSAYPDRHSLALREELGTRLGVSIDNLLVGNGSTELIHLLARAFLGPLKKCLIFTPTFGEYEVAATIVGAEIHLFWAEEERGFQWSMEAAVESIKQVRPDMVFLCNPNNPTGVYLDCSDVERIRGAVDADALLVLDDAYVSLADRQWDSTCMLREGNVAILRSMTKDHALAGVRLGYMVAKPNVVEAVRRLQPAWSVNSVAQAVGIAALNDEAHVAEARKTISESKEYLRYELATLGVPVTDSAANFILARVGEASKMRSALLHRGIAVRDCTSFGLPDHIRIAVRKPEECARLIGRLKEVLDSE